MEDINICRLHYFMNSYWGHLFILYFNPYILSLLVCEYKELSCLYIYAYNLNFTFQIISITSGFSLCHLKLLLSSGSLSFHICLK